MILAKQFNFLTAMENNSARLFSFIFAVSMVVGSWLLFEYGQRPQSSKLPAEHKIDSAPEAYQVEEKSIPQNQMLPKEERSNLIATYHCRSAGGTVYRDHPCSNGEREQKVIFATRTQVSGEELDDLKAKAASMAQARIAAERNSQVEPQHITVQKSNPREVCDAIDRQVETIDAQLRQTNHYAWVDQLNEQRRKLMGRRFSAGC